MSKPASSHLPVLAKEKADRFRSMGALGKPAWQNHVQLRAMLRAKLGEDFANYLAKPSYDPDLGELRWTSEVPGTVRRLSELSEQEQALASLKLVAIRDKLKDFAAELQKQGGASSGGTGAFALLLQQAAKVPSQDFLYFVGVQPVIAFWGFEDQDGRSIDPTFMAPSYAAKGDGGAFGNAATAPVAAAAAVVAPVPAEERKTRPWWWWLLWALLALLLLLALLFGLRSCRDNAVIDTAALPPGGASAPPGTASTPDSSPLQSDPGSISNPGGSVGPGGMTGPGGINDTGVPGGLGGATSGPGGEGHPSMPTDVPQGTNPPDPALDPSKDPKNDPSKEPGKDPTKDPKADPKKDPSKDPKDDPKNKPDDPKKDPKSDPKNDPKQKPSVPPTPRIDPKALKIPPDPAQAKKMDFLEGDWKAGENLADSKTQQPLDLGIKFGKDGKGEISLRRPDGSTCRGPVQGKMDGGRLTVDGSQSIACSNGGTYAAPKIVCQPDSGGHTPCYGVNADGSRYYMGMRRN
ncbi:MAG: hypothetical protein HY855_17630 [Burkholderiales bacterium]|nr:hypothetical protein [Burkholderiales bacterium]